MQRKTIRTRRIKTLRTLKRCAHEKRLLKTTTARGAVQFRTAVLYYYYYYYHGSRNSVDFFFFFFILANDNNIITIMKPFRLRGRNDRQSFSAARDPNYLCFRSRSDDSAFKNILLYNPNDCRPNTVYNYSIVVVVVIAPKTWSAII